MRWFEKRTPASFRRAFFVGCTLIAAPVFGAAPPRPPPELAQVGKPSPEEAAQLVAQVREAGFPGQFYFDFELRSLPRRGKEKRFKGQLWSGRNERGVITRVELIDGDGVMQRFLLQRGEQSKVWRLSDGRAVELTGAELFAPLIPGVEVSAFDLQMPFLFWDDVTVEKLSRVVGRPAWVFLFQPSERFRQQYADITGVRAYLDTQFNAILQTELLGANRRAAKTFSFLSLQRVNDQYVPKQADFRNEQSRDKTRLQVTGVALEQNFPAEIFTPDQLAEPAAPPPLARIVRIDP